MSVNLGGGIGGAGGKVAVRGSDVSVDGGASGLPGSIQGQGGGVSRPAFNQQVNGGLSATSGGVQRDQLQALSKALDQLPTDEKNKIMQSLPPDLATALQQSSGAGGTGLGQDGTDAGVAGATSSADKIATPLSPAPATGASDAGDGTGDSDTDTTNVELMKSQVGNQPM